LYSYNLTVILSSGCESGAFISRNVPLGDSNCQRHNRVQPYVIKRKEEEETRETTVRICADSQELISLVAIEASDMSSGPGVGTESPLSSFKRAVE